MSVIVITPPAPIVDIGLVKQHLRVTSTAEDALVQVYIDAAQGMIDGPAGWLGRCIGQQTLEYRFDGFVRPIWSWDWDDNGLFWDSDPSYGVGCSDGRIALPYPPLISVISVVYEDQNGDDQILPSSDYLATDEGLDASYGTTFPSGRWEANAVRIQYLAGYATIPAPIVSAMLLMIGDLYSNRQGVETGLRAAAVSVPMSTTVEALLAPYRVWA